MFKSAFLKRLRFAPESRLLTPIGYDVVSGLPTSGTMCLCTTVAGKLRQFYNYDVQSNPGFMKRIVVPITPQPPPAVPLADLVLMSMPPRCQFQIMTVD